MKITIQCSFCNKFLAVGAEHAGKKIQCPVCQGTVQLPKTAKVPAPRSPARSTSSPIRQRETDSREPRPGTQRRSQRPPRRSKPERRKRSSRQPRPQQDADNIWNQPLSSRGAAISEDEYENYGLPSRKNSKKRRNADDDNSFGLSDRPTTSSRSVISPLAVCLIVCVVCMMAAGVAATVQTSSPDLANILATPAIIVGLVLFVGGKITMLGNAFGEDPICGFLYLFFPLYSLYFLLSRWDINGGPWLASILGLLTSAMGCGCSAFFLT